MSAVGGALGRALAREEGLTKTETFEQRPGGSEGTADTREDQADGGSSRCRGQAGAPTEHSEASRLECRQQAGGRRAVWAEHEGKSEGRTLIMHRNRWV